MQYKVESLQELWEHEPFGPLQTHLQETTSNSITGPTAHNALKILWRVVHDYKPSAQELRESIAKQLLTNSPVASKLGLKDVSAVLSMYQVAQRKASMTSLDFEMLTTPTPSVSTGGKRTRSSQRVSDKGEEPEVQEGPSKRQRAGTIDKGKASSEFARLVRASATLHDTAKLVVYRKELESAKGMVTALETIVNRTTQQIAELEARSNRANEVRDNLIGALGGLWTLGDGGDQEQTNFNENAQEAVGLALEHAAGNTLASSVALARTRLEEDLEQAQEKLRQEKQMMLSRTRTIHDLEAANGPELLEAAK